MIGAEYFVKTAAQLGFEYCFANPGTTEIPMVAVMESETRIKPVLSLFEGVCSGAADGYGRVAAKPALTLTHLGPGFANSMANLHNARRANTPIVNIIGDHASWHVNYDPPLASDIESMAKTVSGWVRMTRNANSIGDDLQDAMKAAWQAKGQIATLILPMDFQAQQIQDLGKKFHVAAPQRHFIATQVEEVAKQYQQGKSLVFIVGDTGVNEEGLKAAGRLANLDRIKMFAETFPRISHRGGGLPDLDRLPYFPEKAIEVLEQYDYVVCAGVIDPISYFGYEGLPSRLAEPDHLLYLANVGEDVPAALNALADELNAPAFVAAPSKAIELPPAQAELSPASIAKVLAASLTEDCIVSIEGGTCGYPFFTASNDAVKHRVITNTGGAIGQGIPAGFGAALAERGNRVFCLQSDGSAQYTIQTLWSIARENLPITILIAANHRYAILQNELRRFGIEKFSETALSLTELNQPKIDWTALAQAYGLASTVTRTNQELQAALTRTNQSMQPHLIVMEL
ncbi:acetolactate synthase large subunit [Acinetobacter sp. VNH17]|uniref:Acetolactate synthase large subunit n=1 Tax=Acinetobacter thutiue TaxID=2998078 RepID=A0ABT7WN21_9GAMM|nr:acetolactate synthase large subunit [Acinetobacter thutiue]MCY6411938.1 acetolactate synthase large subunit [Acinetobacter thutiue]MDN0014042.1 acetolactate synthase large subunit [Acinetobacter thutiue]